MSYYQIPEHSLMKALAHLKLKKFPANHTIFNMGDPSEEFYIIIKGSVTVKEVIPNSKGYIVRDKITLTEGYCFGEFGMLYNTPHSQTIMSKTEATVITLHKDIFKKYLHHHMYNAEKLRRQQICILIPFFKQLDFITFNHIYRNFLFFKLERHKYVFLEGEKADSIYLVMQGRCRLIKDNKTLMTIGRNCISGLEAVDYQEEKNESVAYTSSLYAIDDLILIKIRIVQLGKYCDKLRQSLKQLKETKDDVMKKLIIRNSIRKKRYEFNYRHQKIKKNSRNDVPILTDKEIKEINHSIKTLITNNTDTNTFKKVSSFKTIITKKNMVIPRLPIKISSKRSSLMVSKSISQPRGRRINNDPKPGFDTFVTSTNSTPVKLRMKLWMNDMNNVYEPKNTSENDTDLRLTKKIFSERNIRKLKLGKRENISQLIGGHINSSVMTWNNTLSKNHYSTGKYEIPLICLTERSTKHKSTLEQKLI